jgi:hypothetical protein
VDYHTYVDFGRDTMAEMLSNNIEQLAYMLTTVLTDVTAADIVDCGSMGCDSDPELVVFNLRKLADAIEHGDLS